MAYDLNRIKKEFRDVCIKAGAVDVVSVPISLNGRMTRTLGRVHHEYSTDVEAYVSTRVEFSKQFIETSTDKSISDVIKHEAAHFIATARSGETHGHDAYFKSICAEIGTDNDTTHTDVERTVDDSKLYKYQIYCADCNDTIGNFSRMCKTIKNIKHCACKRCGKANLSVIQNW